MSSWFEFLSSKGTLKLKNVLPAKGAQKNRHEGGGFLINKMMESSSYSLVAKVHTVRTDVTCAIRF
jgi:hypothetical protein